MRASPGTKLSFHALPVGKLKVQIGSHHTDALVDEGAEITLIRRDFAKIMGYPINKETTGSIRGAGVETPFSGYVTKCAVKIRVRESIWSFQWMTVMDEMDHDIIIGTPWCTNVEMIGMHLHDGTYMVDIKDPVTGRGELLRLIGTRGETPKGKLPTWSPLFEESVRKGAFARMEGMGERVEIMIEEAFSKKEWIKMGLPLKKRRQEDDALGVMFDYKNERIASLRNRADGLSTVFITPEGVEDTEPIDAFLDYDGGTLVVNNEMVEPAYTFGDLLINALEKGSPAVVAKLGEGTVTRTGRKEEKDSWGDTVGPQEELMAMAIGGREAVMSITPEDAKVASIRDWPRPQTVTEVRYFLGMCGYYRNFVKNYSTIASPLTDLTRLDTPWDWSDECEATFKRLKHALMNHEVLMVPAPQKPFIMTTDASQYGIGAVLAQQEGKKLRPIEYMSKNMSSKKLAKSTYERELYALYKALVHCRHFLLGRFFYLRTDHQTLKWIKTQPAHSDALKRWIEVIDQYDFKLEYLKGEYNKVADALSRKADLVSEFGVSEKLTQTLVGAYQEHPVTMDIIRKLQAKDKATEDEFVMVDGLLFLDKAEFKRDVCFTSELWKKTAEQMGSQLQMTSGNHPEANGQAEQMNRVVQHLLRHYIKPSEDDCDEKLPLIASLYNNAVHSSTGVSPNQLHLGWKSRSALDFLLPENRPSATPGTLEYGVQYKKLLQQAVEHIKKAQQAMITSENKHRRKSSFQEGERVWVKASELGHEFRISRKLMPQYLGPSEVLDIVGDEMDDPTYVIHIKLAPFAETDQFPSRRSMLPPTMDGQVDIDDIVDHRDLPVSKTLGRGRPPKPKREYCVRIRHHTDRKEDRWFTREELIDTAAQVMSEYERMLKGKAPAK
ncbi:hypothetical protein CBR_g37913 [Chara braunii]|uniref:Integrase catalytic domain-containing protein n=1 Tax=Chara braunii TaxID=69332 RepID=A0A388LNW0_CHABU|nr:hypothetical protein CBR_g37913 [Chara braunii]|eukprot:GBG84036.1 hypothetical protein CBR_g37913 [Chara braunii]